MILVDSNVLMYSAGRAHPHKAPSVEFLRAVARGAVEATVDAEVLQEVLHRYRSLGRWKDGAKVYDLSRRLFPMVAPITAEVMDRARQLLEEYPGLMARDAVHAAVVQVHQMESICSFDRDFDTVPGVRRIEPGEIV